MVLRRRYGLILIVGLLLTVYALSHSSKFHVVDEVSLFAITESMGLRGAVDTNAIAWTQWVNSPGEVLGAFGPEGDVYSKKGVGPAVVALPWYLWLRFVGRLDIGVGLVQSTLLWNGFVTAVTAALLWLVSVRLGYDDRTGAALALLYGLCTIAWPYASQFFGEPLSALSLLLSFYGLISWRQERRVRWLVLGGAGAALALMTVTAHLLLVGILAAYLVATIWVGHANRTIELQRVAPTDSADDVRTTISALAAFIVPIIVAALFLLFYNYARFGNPFDTGYHFADGEGFSTPILRGLYGLLLSPYRGIVWFTPLFLMSLASFVPFVRRHFLEGLLIAAMSIGLLVMYGMWWMWWAGFAWGPRFLVPLAPFWTLLLAPPLTSLIDRTGQVIQRRQDWRAILAAPRWTGWALIILACLSFLVQLAAVTVNFVNYEILLRSIYPTDWSDPLAFGPPAQGLRDILDSPVFGQFKLMRLGIAANSDLAWLWQDGNLQILLLAVGGAVLLTLLGLAVTWLKAAGQPIGKPGETPGVPSRPVWILAAALPLLVIIIWTTEVSRNPHYGDPDRGYRAALSTICERADEHDVIVTVAPYAYQIPMNWLGTECTSPPPILGYATDSLEHAEALSVMERAVQTYDRIWFVTGGLPPNDPENLLEKWLSETSFKASDTWYDDFRLLVYATPLSFEEAEQIDLNVPLVGTRTSTVTIVSALMPKKTEVGAVIPIEIDYRLDGPNDANLRWFVQMLTMEGFPVALLDTAPDDGYTPFSLLPAREDIAMRAGLLLPAEMPAGQYQIIAGLYNPDSPDAERLRAPDGSDFVRLGTIMVVPEGVVGLEVTP